MSEKKHIIITGASGEIGSAIAHSLASPGSTIWIHYNSNIKKAKELASEIATIGANPMLIHGQFETSKGRMRFISEIKDRIPYCNILVNNAGGLVSHKDPDSYTEKDVASIMGVNFLSAFLLCQLLFPPMIKNRNGKIINISSIGVKFGGGAKTAIYSASKAALENLTINLARRGAEHNVQVNAIRSGVIDTNFHRISTDKDLESRRRLIPAKRLGLPKDIAAAVAYLASPDSSYITGQIIAVSGGE